MEIDLGITILDLARILDFFSQPPLEVAFELFIIFGWALLAWAALYVGLYFLSDEYKESKATANWHWVLLAIDIPQMNEQTPKAVEQMFAHLAGALDEPDIAAKFRHGHKQRWFSFEIISIEGYIQFLIRTEEALRDLVEAAIYAQYPEAEIVEVEDYVDEIPAKYPNETYDIWAADFGLNQDSAYPIRTYKEFEHTISKDMILKDPMSSFLESFSRIGPGEQMWFQMIIEPIGNSWKEDAIKVVKDLIGEKYNLSGRSKVVEAVTGAGMKTLEEIGNQIFGGESSTAKRLEEGPKNMIQYLTPGQGKLVEAIENKISKIGFKTKVRAIYLARKEVFRPQRGVNALLGAINQFNVLSANSLAPVYNVNVSYFLKESRIASRKNLLYKNYKKRKISAPGNPFILNIEELATIWHFPMQHVKTPLLQKATDKKSEPPSGLPIENITTPTSSSLPADGVVPPDQKETLGYATDIDLQYDPEQKFG